MKNKLFLLLSIFFIAWGVQSQDSSPPQKTAWDKGDFFVGVNSNLLEVSTNALGLSPNIGYAISNKDMLWASVWYAEQPRVSTFKFGWQRMVYHSMFMGITGASYGAGKDFGDWNKQVSFEVGVQKPLWSWLLISPKIAFVRDWNQYNSQIYFNTGVTFAIKLKPKSL